MIEELDDESRREIELLKKLKKRGAEHSREIFRRRREREKEWEEKNQN